MPELPEVETVRCGLAPYAEGRQIVSVTCNRPNLRYPFPDGFAERLTGRCVQRIDRRAKYLLWRLEGGLSLVVHLGMSGKLLYSPALPNNQQAHDHVRIMLSDGGCVTYNDPRRFGFMGLVDTAEEATHPWFVALGPEPLHDAWDGAALYSKTQKRRVAIKQLLLNQQVVVGVGNIYACEALFRAGIHPERPALSLAPEECSRLVTAIKAVLTEAIASGGSTLRDYVRSSGDVGYFQHHFAVYGREGEGCTQCAQTVLRVQQGGRSTFYCESCQPALIHKHKQNGITLKMAAR